MCVLISVYDISGHFPLIAILVLFIVSVGCVSVYNVCFQCFCKLYQSACSSSNCLVCTVFQSASLSSQFHWTQPNVWQKFVWDYSRIPSDSVNLVTELRQLTFCTRLSDFSFVYYVSTS